MILRETVLQSLLDLFEAPRYLEVGVEQGHTFLPLKARRKVAVDPKFHFPYADGDDGRTSLSFFEMPSDAYFQQTRPGHDMFDVIFLDGLHVFEQTLRDLLNAVMLLSPRGIIVVDDVVPETYQASLASLTDVSAVRTYMIATGRASPEEGAWMGDIYKIPLFVRSFMQQFSYATIADNHGQTVLWKQPRAASAELGDTIEGIARMEFKDFVRRRAEMRLMPFEAILAELAGRP